MTTLYLGVAAMLLLTILVGFFQVFRQSGRAETLLAALLFGTAGVAVVLLLGKGLGMARAVDVALVIALLAAVLSLAFVLRGWPKGRVGEDAKR